MSDVILQTTHLTKEFKGFTAVSDVNLSVQRGSIHALIGPNGAGKTTCFNLLTKFLEPTSGEIRFNGHDITREAPAQIARISCPIGDPALGKHPQAIAIGVAAAILAPATALSRRETLA